jgi:hypothetical protein
VNGNQRLARDSQPATRELPWRRSHDFRGTSRRRRKRSAVAAIRRERRGFIGPQPYGAGHLAQISTRSRKDNPGNRFGVTAMQLLILITK